MFNQTRDEARSTVKWVVGVFKQHYVMGNVRYLGLGLNLTPKELMRFVHNLSEGYR